MYLLNFLQYLIFYSLKLKTIKIDVIILIGNQTPNIPGQRLESAQHTMRFTAATQANPCQKNRNQAAMGRAPPGPSVQASSDTHHQQSSQSTRSLLGIELTRDHLLDLPSASFQTSIFSTQPTFMITNSDSEFQVHSLLKSQEIK